MRRDADALILGGGLNGGTLALALASAGLSSVVIEAAPVEARLAGAFDGRSSAIAAGSMRMLSRLGAWPQAQAQPINDIVVTDGRVGEGAAPVFLHFDHRETGKGPFGWLLENRHLRAALQARLEREPLIRMIAPAKTLRLERADALATAHLSNGESVSAPVALVCEGRESPTAAAAGFRFVRWSYDQSGLVATIAHEKPHEGVAHEYFLPSGPFAILPLTGNRSSLVWTERPAAARAAMALRDEDFLEHVRRRVGSMLGGLSLASPRWSYPLTFSLARSYVQPRLALVGDAAHGVHPIAGQGLNLGLRDVAVLAEELAEGARRGEDLGDLGLLGRHERRRRFDNAAMGLGMDAMNRLFSNDFGPLRLLRGAGLAAVQRLAPLKRSFMAQAAGESGSLPRLLRGEAL